MIGILTLGPESRVKMLHFIGEATRKYPNLDIEMVLTPRGAYLRCSDLEEFLPAA